MIKLIFTDMDGTLLHNDKRMPDETEALFMKLHDQGILCGAASGRSLESLKEVFPKFSKYASFIADNGAAIYHEGKVIYKSVIPTEWAHEVLSVVGSVESIHPLVCTLDHAYAFKRSKPNDAYFRNYYPAICYVDDLFAIEDEIIKLAIFDDEDAAQNTYPKIQHFQDRMKVTVSAKEWTDVNMPGVHKGFAVNKIQELLKITKDECMAFGDYHNDIEMLESVTHSYAMANAVEEVKAVSKYICPSNEEEGVIQTLKEKFNL